MTRTIHWKGKIGYGDIISPICYAHNEADKRKEPVDLVFHFDHDSGTKFKDQDAETINERVDFIRDHTTPSKYPVRVDQYCNSRMESNHTNYSDNNLSYHNLRYSNKYKWKPTTFYRT